MHRIESYAKLAPIFSAWQNIVADPNLDRKLASEVVILELGMVISGTLFCHIPVTLLTAHKEPISAPWMNSTPLISRDG